jgi:hypothetical protein
MMTTEQKEKLREVLIDYLQVLTLTSGDGLDRQGNHEQKLNAKIAEVRLLLREVA